MAFGEYLAGAIPDFQQLNSGLGQALADPRTSAALMSFAAQAAQPQQWGQSGFGHLLSSVAAGGAGVRQADEQARKDEELAIKQREAESKQGLREASALLAESRAANAGTMASNAAERLAFRQNELDQRRSLAELQRQRQVFQGWERMVAKVREANSFLPAARQQPVPTFQEYLQQNPVMLQNLGLTPESFSSAPPGGSPTTPDGGGGTPAPTATTPQPRTTPPPVATRPHGYRWNDSPQGPVQWDKNQGRWIPIPR